MKWQHLALLLLLATAAVLPSRADDADAEDDDEDFDEERSVILVRRKVADERPLEGKLTTVTISLYNAGNTAAKNVKLVEAAWPADGFTVEGELAAAFDRIPEGASVQHTYKVAGKAAGLYQHPPTTVTYIPGEDEAAQTATSSALRFRTFTIVESLLGQALEWGSKLSGGNLNTVSDWRRLGYGVAALAAALFGYRTYTSVSASSANRKRAKALAELAALEKDK